MRTSTIAQTFIVATSLMLTTACASSGREKPSGADAVGASAVAATASPKCQYGSGTYRRVHVDEFADMCMAPRKDPADTVRIPKKSDVFISDCAITLGTVDAATGNDVCAPSTTNNKLPALKQGDRMLITKNAAGKFLLTRLRGSDMLTFELPTAGSHENGTSFLSGEHDGVTYVVYIQNDDIDAHGNFDKFYRFEAFDSDVKNPGECAKHKPIDPTIETCPTITVFSGSQTGTSTGGEPPVK